MAPKPGVIPLQPLGLSEILNGAFATLRRYLKPLYVPLLAVMGASTVLLGVLGAIAYEPAHTLWVEVDHNSDYTPGNGQLAEILVLGGLAVLLAVLSFFACYVVCSTVSTTVLRHAVLGRKATVRQVWDQSRPYLWRVACDNLLLSVGTFLVAGAVLGTALAVAIATHSPAAFVLLFLLVIPVFGAGIYAQVRLVLVTPVLVLENERPIAALRRAWRLNEGAWWRSLGIPYLINMIGSLAVQVVLVPFAMAAAVVFSLAVPSNISTDSSDPTVPVGLLAGLYLAMWVVMALVYVLIMPLGPLTNGLLYMDRRIRRESLDVALAEQAGVGFPATDRAAGPADPAAPTGSAEPTDPVSPVDLGK